MKPLDVQRSSVSLGLSSPNSSVGLNLEETGWKLGAWGSAGGAVLINVQEGNRRKS